jgi:predicted  nucleic acid-binding Zn-ribbon protein
MTESTPVATIDQIVELSKTDVLIAGLELQKKKFLGDVAGKKQALAGQGSNRASKQALLETKRALVAREEKAIKVERERINERRRALHGTDYKVQQAMEREIEFVSKQVGQREDVLLGVMREVEILERDIAVLSESIEGGSSELSAFEAEALGEVETIEGRLKEYNEQRMTIVKLVGPTHPGLVAYNRVRTRYPLDPIVPIINRANCGGCHMSLGPQIIVQVSRGEVVKCAGCGRILRLEKEVVEG